MGEFIQLEADGVAVARDKRTGEQLLLLFTSGADKVEVSMDIQSAPILAKAIEDANAQTRSPPIAQGEALAGSAFHSAGYQVRRLHDGGAVLTVTIVSDEGLRSIPIDLSPAEAVHLSQVLAGEIP
jgi:hypothetical protein